MARMLHRPEAPVSGQKVFIAVAAYEGCGAGFTWSLFHTGAALAKAGVGYELAIYSGNCHVDDSRNRLVRDFLSSDCTDMVFLDVDVGWAAPDFVRLLAYDRDVVAGVYPKKHGDDTYPVRTLPGEIWSEADGLIEVAGVPTGFLRIRRPVLEQLAEVSVKYNAKNDGAFATPCIFERQIHEGVRWGGDYVFCRKWRAMGGKVYIDPAMRFEHSGEQTWHGQVGMWLKKRSGIALDQPLARIRAGAAGAEDMIDLFDAWENPFAAEPVLLSALAALAREAKGPILETGSGLSSLVLAAANPHVEIHALEDAPIFADYVDQVAKRYGLSNLTVHCLPLKDGWYDTEGLPKAKWGLVFLDGPRRSSGRRADAVKHLDLSQAIIVADDTGENAAGAATLQALSESHDMHVFPVNNQRAFAVGKPRKSAEARAA